MIKTSLMIKSQSISIEQIYKIDIIGTLCYHIRYTFRYTGNGPEYGVMNTILLPEYFYESYGKGKDVGCRLNGDDNDGRIRGPNDMIP